MMGEFFWRGVGDGFGSAALARSFHSRLGTKGAAFG